MDQPASVGRFSFEKLDDETASEYRNFAAFMQDREGLSPAEFIKANGWDKVIIDQAVRNRWMIRRNDYWNYLIAKQRQKYVQLIGDFYDDIVARRDLHNKRIDKAIQSENGEKDKKGEPIASFVTVDEAIDAQLKDMRMVLSVVNALKNDSKSITIINTAVGQINPATDVNRFVANWDQSSGSVVDGTARIVDKSTDSPERS